MKLQATILAILLATSCCAQHQAARRYSVDHGMPSNTIYTSLVDTDGKIWFGTERGVSVYDGHRFTNYTVADGLSDNEVFNLTLDSKNRMWFITYNGVPSYYQNGKFYNPENKPYLGKLQSNSLLSHAYEGRDGTIYFNSRKKGIIELRDTVFSKTTPVSHGAYFWHAGKKFFCSANSGETTIYKVDSKNNFDSIYHFSKILYHEHYIKTKDGIAFIARPTESSLDYQFFIWNGESLSAVHQPLKELDDLRIFCVEKFDDNIFIGTNNGLYVYSSVDYSLKYSNYLSQSITSVSRDFENNYWFTTLKRGVYFSSSHIFQNYAKTTDYINCLSFDSLTNTLWAGGIDQYYSFRKNEKRSYRLDKVWNEKVSTLIPLENGDVWVGSGVYTLKHRDGKAAKFYNHHGLKTASKNPYNRKLLMGMATLVIEADPSEYVPDDSSTFTRIAAMRGIAVFAVSSDEVLISSNRGLYLLNRNSGEKNIVLPFRVSDIAKDQLGRIWISSPQKGLYLYQNRKLKQFTANTGIPYFNIHNIAVDHKNHLWMASDKQIIRGQYSDGLWKANSYSFSSSQESLTINDIAADGDSIFLATSEGLFVFNPKTYQPNISKPRFMIDRVSIDGKAVIRKPAYNLRPGKSIVHLEYSGISYSYSDLQFRYSLNAKEDEPEWQYTTARSLDLPNLGPGKYIFTVQAVKNHQIYSEAVQILFNVSAPFYKKTWFYALIFLIISGIIAFAAWWKLRAMKRHVAMNYLISRSQQKALRAQMNPHFLFNALNSIQQFFLHKNPSSGQEYINKFSKLIRNVLDNSERESISLKDEIESLTNYMELEKLRMDEPFEYRFTIDKHIDEYNLQIPSMLIQPLVENAIWHGLNYLNDERGHIHITFTINELQDLVIQVRDNGIGIKRSAEINAKRKHNSKGSDLIKDRIFAINSTRKKKIVYSLSDQSLGGALAEIYIPNEEL